MFHFKTKNSGIKRYPLYLGNISKDFKIDKMNKAGLKESVQFFSVEYNAIDTNYILNIYKYLLKGAWYEVMFRFLKKSLLSYQAFA